VAKGRPLLGICLGMQVLADDGEERGAHTGLGWIHGRVRRLAVADMGLRVPHIGWNGARSVSDHPVLAGLSPTSTFYYVHSYVFDPADQAHTVATCEYGESFTCAVARDNIIATQFHPEKSQRDGLAILDRFSRWSP
jgi:imidazole glycerol-phosphate synthase subunit HisH